MEDLTKLPNIGKVVAGQLNEVGIYTFDELKKMGSKQAWLKILAIDDSACIQRLQGLEGAIQGVRKLQLSDDVKADLKEFYNAVKS